MEETGVKYSITKKISHSSAFSECKLPIELNLCGIFTNANRLPALEKVQIGNLRNVEVI